VNLALVAGCSAGGLVIGGVLDSLSGRIVRAPDPETPTAEAVTQGSVATAVATRVPSAVEVAGSALLTAVAFGLAAGRLGALPALAAYCALFAGLVALSVVDARIGIVPRSVLFPTFAATAVGLVAASGVDHRWGSLAHAALGGAIAFAVFFALWWFFPRGLGYGDVRLAGVMGAGLAWIGFGELYVGFLTAFAVGAAVGVTLMVRNGTGRKTRLPFGPPLAIGAAFGVLWGAWAVHVWLHHG
jgi:leader peptidase (prepilin peptidase)/N-methyltransferase